jgi:hypothetical protein
MCGDWQSQTWQNHEVGSTRHSNNLSLGTADKDRCQVCIYTHVDGAEVVAAVKMEPNVKY